MTVWNQILASALNSLWQTAALASTAYLGLRFLPRVNAATRYAVWWTVLAAMLVLPLARVSVARQPFHSNPARDARSSDSVWTAVAAPATVIERRDPIQPASFTAATDGERVPLELRNGTWTRWLLAIWIGVFLARFGFMVRSYRHLRGIKRRSLPASREQRLAFDCWRMSCGIDRPVQLLISREIVSPMAAGFLHPAVIVPAALVDQFTEPELDHVLLHELAHVARLDDWTNLAARVADAAFGLHPVAAWVLKRIDREREIACDDWVVAMTGDARPYAASLTRLFELCSSRRRHVLATGMADRASHLGERIEMLLRRGRDFVPGTSLSRVATVAAVLLALVLAGAQAPQWVAFAQETAAPVPPAPAVPAVPPHAPAPAKAAVPAISPATAVPAAPASDSHVTKEPIKITTDFNGKKKTFFFYEFEAQRAAKAPNPPRPPAAPQAPQPAQAPQAPLPPQPPRPPQAAQNGSFLAALVAAGYGDLSVDEIIDLRNSGMSAEFLTEIGQSGWGKLTSRQLIELCRNGVSPGYLRGMKEAGMKDLSVQDVIEMSRHGVRPDFFREVHALGFGPYTAKQAIEFANSGVRPDLFRALKEYNFTNLDPREIIEMANNGIGASDLRAAKGYGPNLTLKQILRLKQAGVI